MQFRRCGHPEDFRLHCKDCSIYICKRCLKAEHIEHNWDPSQSDDFKNIATDWIPEHLKCVQDLRKELEEILESDRNNQSRILDDIQKRKAELLSMIDKEGIQSIGKCEQFFGERRIKIEERIKYLTETEQSFLSLQKRLGKGRHLENVVEETSKLVEEYTREHNTEENLPKQELIYQRSRVEFADVFGNLMVNTTCYTRSSTSTQPQRPSTDIQNSPTSTQRPHSSTQRPSTGTQRPSTVFQRPSTGTSRPPTSTQKYPYKSNLSPNWKYLTEFRNQMAYVAVLSALPNQRVWGRYHHKQEISQFDIDGKIQAVHQTGSKSAGDFVVTQRDQLLFCDYKKRSILLMKIGSKGVQHPLQDTGIFIPLGVCVTKTVNNSYDLYVGLSDDFEYNITERSKRFVKWYTIRETTSTDNKREFVNDNKTGKRLFTYPYRMVANDSSLCVVDQTSLSSGRIIILDRYYGDTKGTYSGNSSFQDTFDPRGCCFDEAGHLVVTDATNNAIHVLNSKNAQLQRMLVSPDQGIAMPRTVSIAGGILWIGCDNGTIIVFKNTK